MAELKPLPSTEGLSLSRWSRLKRSGGDAVAAPPPEAVTPIEALDAGGQSAAPELELPPISTISLAEDFTPFMQAKVPQALKQQALKALFKEPHFNVMDGLDIYIDDYTVFEPISPEVMATLSSWKTIMNPPQQVVTPGGYAVDAESEEGKAVLVARAEIVEANAMLPPSTSGLQVPSPAARGDTLLAFGFGAQGEGGDAGESTSLATDPAAIDDTLQWSDEADAAALTSTLSRTAGEGAKPHLRYGRRVGDFSASEHQTPDDAVRESSTADPNQTASAAPKSSTQ